MANQIIIDIGAVANDGTGDPLRTAFGYVNDNFSNVWATGVANSNIQFSGNKILTVNTNGNLVLAPNGTGKVQANVDIIPNANNTLSLGAIDKRWNTVYARNLDVDGNVTFAGDITISSDLVVDGNLTVNGTTTSVNTTEVDIEDKVITIAYGSPNASSANGSGITVGGANANIIYNQTANAWTFNIGVSATGNITAPYFIGNGSQLTGITSYGNSNVSAYLASGTNTANIITTGNISAGNISGTFVAPGGNQDMVFNRNGILSTASGFNYNYPGNILYAPAAGFSGDLVTGTNGLFVGHSSYTELGSDILGQFSGNVNAYSQINSQNSSNGVAASGDYVITADNGNDTSHFINLGITSSGWNGTQPNSLGNRLGPNDGYLYVQDGDLVVGTNNGSIYTWKFDQAGNLTVPGNVLPAGNNTQNLGSSSYQWNDLYLSNATIYMNSVPISLTAGNVLTVNGDDVVTTNANGTVNLGNLTVNDYNIYNAAGQGVIISNFSFVDEAETAYVQIPAGNSTDDLNVVQEQGNVRLVANSAVWNFSTDGNLTIPNGGYINFVNTGGITQALNEDLRFTVSDDEEDGWAVQSTVNDGAGNDLTRMQVRYDGVQINTDLPTNNYNWTFRDSGEFDVPKSIRGPVGGNLIIECGDQFGSTTFIDLQTRSYVGDALISNIRIGDPNVTISTASGAQNWTFGNTGTLTFPSLANISGGNFNAGTASATVALNAFSPDGNTVSIQAQGNSSSAVISIFANAGPVTNNWVFTHAALDPTEAYLYVPGGASITTPNATGGAAGKNIFIEAGSADQSDFYTSAGGELFLKGGRGAFNDGGGGGPGGNVNINAGESSDPAGHAGNVYVTAGALTNWIFDYSGNLTLPTNSFNVNYANGTAVSLGGNYGNANVADFLDSLGSNAIVTTGNINAGNLNATTGIANVANLYMNTGYVNTPASTGINIVPGSTSTGTRVWSKLVPNANVAFSLGSTTEYWANGYIGNVIATTGNFTGNVTAANFSGNISITGNVTGTSSNVTLVAGSYSYTFDNTGVLSLPAVGGDEGGEIHLGIPTANTTLQDSVKIDVYQDRLRFFEGSANAKGAYLDLANCPSSVSAAIGYRDIPQISFSANATATGNAAGCHYYSTTAGNLALTLPDNSNVAFPTGATLTIVMNAAGNVIVAQGTGVTLYMAGSSTTGNRTVGAYGLASVMKVATNTWVISGTGVY